MRKHRVRTQIIRDALTALQEPDGSIHPRKVFEAARDPEHPLHSEFTWSGKEAIEKLGLQTAAKLIRSYRVEIVVRNHKVAVPYYVRAPEKNADKVYAPIDQIRRDEDRSRCVLLDELRRIENALGRARRLSIVFNLESEMDALLESTINVRNRIESEKEESYGLH